MGWKYGDASDDYLLADILKQSSLGEQFVYNPITSRYIKNNSTNRKSIIQQIKTSRLNSQGIQYYADSEGGNIKISGKSIALIGCSSKKQPGRVKAKELYCSPLFDFSQAWADNRWIDYGILSAQHPELAEPSSGPEMLIENYDNKITSMNSKERQSWAERVVSNITKPKPSKVSIVKKGKAITKKRLEAKNEIKKIYLLAGKSYTNELIPELKKKFPDAELIEPLSGMQIGERLKFLKADKDGFQEAADNEYGPGKMKPGEPRGFRIKTGKISQKVMREIRLSPDPEEIYRPSEEKRLLSDLLDSGEDFEQYMALIKNGSPGS